MKWNRLISRLIFSVWMMAACMAHAQDVDPLTGRARIQVPLGGLQAYDLSIALNLWHHGGSLKVEEGPGNAGMGWNVNLGGYIAREVRGIPDEFNQVDSLSGTLAGWLYTPNAAAFQTWTPQADNNLAVCTDEANDWTYLDVHINGHGTTFEYTTGQGDTEPDMYYFNAPGLSGRFIYGADGQIKLIPYQDLKITTVTNGFTITTATGTVYTFDVKETTEMASEAFAGRNATAGYTYSTSQIPYASRYTTAWHVSSIKSTATGTTATYSYTLGEAMSASRHVSGIKPGVTSTVDTLYHDARLVNTVRVNQISLGGYTVTVGWNGNVIGQLVFSEQESGETKEYQLVYQSIRSTTDQSFSPIYQPFLSEVKQMNACTAYPSWKFSYQGLDTLNALAAVPWRTGWGQDFFGYYNGQDANKNIPTVYFYAGESGSRRYRVTPIPSLSATQTLTGQDRSVNAVYNGFGAVRQVRYPSGGYTQYTYEANKYFDASTNEELAGAGVRVASVTTTGGEVASGRSATATGYHALTRTYQYVNGSGTYATLSSGRILHPPVFAYTDGTDIYRSQDEQGGGTEVMYARVKESTSGQGCRVYNYDLPNVYPDQAPAVAFSRVARPSGTACSSDLRQNDIYAFPFAPLTDYSFKRGLLTRVSEYDEAGNRTYDKRINYISPQTGGVVKAVRYGKMSDGNTNDRAYYYSVYQVPVNQSRIVAQETVVMIGDNPADSVKTITAYHYNGRNMPTKTIRTLADGSVQSDSVRYALDYAITTPGVNDIQANAIYKLNTTNRYGEVIEAYSTFTPIGGAATVTGATLNVFKDYGTYVWPYQRRRFPQGLSFTVSGATATAFTADSKYITEATYDYVNALPVGQTGLSLIPSGAHYASASGMPLASFVNCKGPMAVYEGFECVSANGLAVSGGTATYGTARTGRQALSLTTALTLTSRSLVTKGDNTYRVSAWVYGAAAATLTVQAKNGTTVQATGTLSYTTPNQWAYLEGTMDMTNASASFTLQVTTSATVLVDDVVALPRSARISTTTIQPLAGATSQTDDRGNSSLVTYDPQGRPLAGYDRQRNLVSVTEYGQQVQGSASLIASFTSSVSEYFLQQPATFTADTGMPNSCVSGATYAWTFKDAFGATSTASGSSITKTFSSFGSYQVTLTVSAPGYASASYSQDICVHAFNTVSISVDNPAVYNPCVAGETGQRTFTANIGSHPPIGWNLKYEWYYTGLNGTWIPIANFLEPNYPQVLSLSVNVLSIQCPPYSYSVYCLVTATPVSPLLQKACIPDQILGAAQYSVLYAKSGNCQ